MSVCFPVEIFSKLLLQENFLQNRILLSPISQHVELTSEQLRLSENVSWNSVMPVVQ